MAAGRRGSGYDKRRRGSEPGGREIFERIVRSICWERARASTGECTGLRFDTQPSKTRRGRTGRAQNLTLEFPTFTPNARTFQGRFRKLPIAATQPAPASAAGHRDAQTPKNRQREPSGCKTSCWNFPSRYSSQGAGAHLPSALPGNLPCYRPENSLLATKNSLFVILGNLLLSP
jgi:hypothetical protein